MKASVLKQLGALLKQNARLRWGLALVVAMLVTGLMGMVGIIGYQATTGPKRGAARLGRLVERISALEDRTESLQEQLNAKLDWEDFPAFRLNTLENFARGLFASLEHGEPPAPPFMRVEEWHIPGHYAWYGEGEGRVGTLTLYPDHTVRTPKGAER